MSSLNNASTQPNIVLISADQWRGDCLSINGHPVVQTPYLDQMAVNGVRFSHAYSTCPTCTPARASLYTGMSPRATGRVGYQDGVPWNYPVTIASEFTQNGYQTQAVGKLHVYPERSQIGFQNVILHDGYLGYARQTQPSYAMVDDYLPWLRQHLGYDADDFDHGLWCNSMVARPWDKPEHLHPTNFVTTQSIDFLRRRDPRKPFFLYMSYHRPHPPLDPPAWAFEQYINRKMPDLPVGDWIDTYREFEVLHDPQTTVGMHDANVMQRARAGYYGLITHIDHQINRFLVSLEHFNLHENTYICFLSDHGEMLGDHHLFKKMVPYEGSAHVPMILRGPGGSGFERGSSKDAVVSLEDVMPTLLNCAGLSIPETVTGESFLPIARGEAIPWRDYIHGEHVVFGQSIQWITNGSEKYVWLSGRGEEQFFDLTQDPQELHNLAVKSEFSDRVSQWRYRLIKELNGREEGFTNGEALIAGQPVNPLLAHLRGQFEPRGPDISVR